MNYNHRQYCLNIECTGKGNTLLRSSKLCHPEISSKLSDSPFPFAVQPDDQRGRVHRVRHSFISVILSPPQELGTVLLSVDLH
jgi:hypothetical protein